MWFTDSPEQTFALAQALGALLLPGDTVFLTGDLGTGKSVFARGVAGALGIREPMASPTFTLMYPYEGRCRLYHFDLYRLEEPEEFYQAGLEEFVGGDGVALIEWPDHADLLPEPRLEVRIERGEGDDERWLTLTGFGMDERQSRMEAALSAWRRDEGEERGEGR